MVRLRFSPVGLSLKHLVDPLTSPGKRGAHRHDWYFLSGTNETCKRNIKFPMKDLLANQEELVCLRLLSRNVLKLSSVLALLENH